MGILPTVNEDCVVPAPNNISTFIETDELEDSPFDGRVNTIGKSSSYALCCVQNQEMDFGESNQYGFQIEQRSTEFHSISFGHGGCDYHALDIGQNHNPQNDKVKDNTTQKKEIPLERIQTLMSQNMRLVDAAKQLLVSRSTLKRSLKKYGLKWPSSRKTKQPQDARSKKQKTKSPRVVKISSSLNLMNPANLVGHNLSVEQVINMLDQLAHTGPVCDVPSDRDAAVKKITQALSLSTLSGRQSVKDRLNGAEGGASLDSIKQPKSSSTFIVKANYNGDNIKFEFALSSSIEKLKEEVSKRLEVDIGKMKIRYQDEDGDWILIKVIADLEHAPRFSNSSGSDVVKLSITTSES